MVHPLGLLHIGGAAHCLWAYPPNFGRTAHRHVQVHRRATVAYPTVADAMIETGSLLNTIKCTRPPTTDQCDCTRTIFGCCSSSLNTRSESSRIQARHSQPARSCVVSRVGNSSPHSTQRCEIGTIRLLAMKVILVRVCQSQIRHAQWLCHRVQAFRLLVRRLLSVLGFTRFFGRP